MEHPWLVLAGIAIIALVYVLAPVVASAYARFRGARAFRCPLAGTNVEVTLDAGHAALTAAFGPPALRINRCTLWPQRTWCAQACLRSGVIPGVEEPDRGSPGLG
jgi:hypothetical protein